eukprot:COSAG02_NODE_349_length_24073_cov_102.816092_1_plen_120_part_00
MNLHVPVHWIHTYTVLVLEYYMYTACTKGRFSQASPHSWLGLGRNGYHHGVARGQVSRTGSVLKRKNGHRQVLFLEHRYARLGCPCGVATWRFLRKKRHVARLRLLRRRRRRRELQLLR